MPGPVYARKPHNPFQYQCVVQGCEQQFQRRYGLVRHLRTTHPEFHPEPIANLGPSEPLASPSSWPSPSSLPSPLPSPSPLPFSPAPLSFSPVALPSPLPSTSALPFPSPSPSPSPSPLPSRSPSPNL